jgi:bifunctional non-homologous end joining protein LigD
MKAKPAEQPKVSTREQKGSFEIDGRQLQLSNLQKVMYPETGFTKGEVIDYYIRVAPVLLPHLKDKPLTLKRYPNGVEGEFFYEKRAPKYRPAWMQTATVISHNDEKDRIDYCLANDLSSLVWCANLADIELHPMLGKKQDVDCPTQIVFDLDPGAPANAIDCAQVALWLKELFDKMKLASFIKSSGSKGLQLHIPLNTPTSYDVTKPFAKAVAMAMTQAHPDRVVYDMKKTLREGKVLIDWSQNDRSKTTVLVYSLRAKPHPFVATPLQWSEVTTALKKGDPASLFFESNQVLERVEKLGDVFAEVLTLKQKLPKDALKGLENISVEEPIRRLRKPAAKPVAEEAKPESGSKLAAYEAKRDFKQTKEPSGKTAKVPGEPNLFVIQKHDASHLHYDFRLAMDGVLKSWAVPKAIPTAKGEKHLAMQVEDHPLDYARFEGIIPKGNYGGGTVMVWDVGKYRMLGGTPIEAWNHGLIHLQLEGKKLNGEWSLIRLKPEASGKQAWLLLKSGQATDAISAKVDDQSAISGRTMKQIADQKTAEWQSNRPPKGTPAPAVEPATKPELKVNRKPAPKAEAGLSEIVRDKLARRFVEPMKCLAVKTIPKGGDWIYELKFDGYRALAICEQGQTLLLSRNNNSFNERFPALVKAVAKLPVKSAILDGEIVAMGEGAQHSFQLLQNYEGGPLAYYFFDLLELDGKSLRDLPLKERKARLAALLKSAPSPLFFSADLKGDPDEIWKAIKKQHSEGIIAKKQSSVYETGRRSGNWAKIKAVNQQEFVIGGFTEPAGARSHFGALLVGVYEGGKLRFCGRVGTGFDDKLLESLFARMSKLRMPNCPFFNLPTPRNSKWGGGVTASQMKLCTWIKPELVGEVQFTEWTGDDSLRHPSFLGLREDVAAADVVREKPV